MGKRDFTRFWFKMRFGWTSYIAPPQLHTKVHRHTFPCLCVWEGCVIILLTHGQYVVSVLTGSLDFISYDSAQSTMCAVRRIHNSLNVVFCFMHATPSHYHHHSGLLSSIENIRRNNLEACVNAGWVHTVESVSKIWLVLSVTLLILFVIHGGVYVKMLNRPIQV